jgi:hypothetical protein
MSKKVIATHLSIETAHERNAAMPTPTKKTTHHASAETNHPKSAAMKTKKTTHHASTETNATENTAMPTPIHSHPVTTTHQTNPTKEETAMPSSKLESPAQPTVHPSIAAAPPAASVTPAETVPPVAAAPIPAVAPPPTSANIPATPAGFSPASPGEFRNVVPRQAELAAMPQALTDLSKFTDFDALFAGIGLTQSEVTVCLTMASDWSTMRVATTQWDRYCVLQEGYAWRAARAALVRLGQAFLLAAQANPKLVASYPGLSSLLGVKKAIAQKGASTRRLNNAAKAKGEPQIHGIVGKKRQRRAAKAALASGASAAPGGSVPSASPVAQGAQAAPVSATTSVSPALSNGVANGVAH